MKVISFLILCSVIIYVNTAEFCGKRSASSSKDCKDLDVYKTGDHCCYLKGSTEELGIKKVEINICWEITQEEYDKIDETIKKLEDEVVSKGGKASIDKLDCKSSYIVLSLFSLILFLL